MKDLDKVNRWDEVDIMTSLCFNQQSMGKEICIEENPQIKLSNLFISSCRYHAFKPLIGTRGALECFPEANNPHDPYAVIVKCPALWSLSTDI